MAKRVIESNPTFRSNFCSDLTSSRGHSIRVFLRSKLPYDERSRASLGVKCDVSSLSVHFSSVPVPQPNPFESSQTEYSVFRCGVLGIVLASLVISLQGCGEDNPSSSPPNVEVDKGVESPPTLDASVKDADSFHMTPDGSAEDAEIDMPSPPPSYVPLYDESTPLNPSLQEETDEALITRFADRARDRHAREDEFQAYDHYLSFTGNIEL